ncbi:hypothetical protein HK253_01020 [Streptococcus agalactiae]|nr:hypothetical protein [Streptococcus agalactiae]
MHFFLSEHTTSLADDRNKVDMTQTLTKVEKLTLIGQLYAGHLTGMFVIKKEKAKKSYLGEVTQLTPNKITIKSSDKYHLISVDDILEISMIEELDDE